MESGTYPWRKVIMQNTSDWLGPYNLVLPETNTTNKWRVSSIFESRYVATAATDYLKPPVNYTISSKSLFDQYAGATAVHATVARQATLKPGQDPYASSKETCQTDDNNDGGDIRPILPRFRLQHSLNVDKKGSSKKNDDFLQVDFAILSLSHKNDDSSLAHVWPAFQKHLPDFPVVGPYCFEGDKGRAFALNISFDSTRGDNNNTWKWTAGCVDELPCWPQDNHNDSPVQPHGDGGGSHSSPSTVLWKAVQTYGVYILLVALVVSLTLNCQYSYQLQQIQDRRNEEGGSNEESGASRHRQRRRTLDEETSLELQEPLLPIQPANTADDAPDSPEPTQELPTVAENAPVPSGSTEENTTGTEIASPV